MDLPETAARVSRTESPVREETPPRRASSSSPPPPPAVSLPSPKAAAAAAQHAPYPSPVAGDLQRDSRTPARERSEAPSQGTASPPWTASPPRSEQGDALGAPPSSPPYSPALASSPPPPHAEGHPLANAPAPTAAANVAHLSPTLEVLEPYSDEAEPEPALAAAGDPDPMADANLDPLSVAELAPDDLNSSSPPRIGASLQGDSGPSAQRPQFDVPRRAPAASHGSHAGPARHAAPTKQQAKGRRHSANALYDRPREVASKQASAAPAQERHFHQPRRAQEGPSQKRSRSPLPREDDRATRQRTRSPVREPQLAPDHQHRRTQSYQHTARTPPPRHQNRSPPSSVPARERRSPSEETKPRPRWRAYRPPPTLEPIALDSSPLPLPLLPPDHPRMTCVVPAQATRHEFTMPQSAPLEHVRSHEAVDTSFAARRSRSSSPVRADEHATITRRLSSPPPRPTHTRWPQDQASRSDLPSSLPLQANPATPSVASPRAQGADPAGFGRSSGSRGWPRQISAQEPPSQQQRVEHSATPSVSNLHDKATRPVATAPTISATNAPTHQAITSHEPTHGSSSLLDRVQTQTPSPPPASTPITLDAEYASPERDVPLAVRLGLAPRSPSLPPPHPSLPARPAFASAAHVHAENQERESTESPPRSPETSPAGTGPSESSRRLAARLGLQDTPTTSRTADVSDLSPYTPAHHGNIKIEPPSDDRPLEFHGEDVEGNVMSLLQRLESGSASNADRQLADELADEGSLLQRIALPSAESSHSGSAEPDKNDDTAKRFSFTMRRGISGRFPGSVQARLRRSPLHEESDEDTGNEITTIKTSLRKPQGPPSGLLSCPREDTWRAHVAEPAVSCTAGGLFRRAR